MSASSQERAEGRRRRGRRGALGALAAWAWVAAACWGCADEGASGPSVDSETHWLRACDGEGDPSCGGLDCVCGVCTQPCAEEEACASFGAGAVCQAPDAQAQACGAEASAPACALGCDGDADCAQLRAGLVCVGGACLPDALASGGGTNNGGGGTNSGTTGTNSGTTAPPDACGGDTGRACAPEARCAYPEDDVCGLVSAGTCVARPSACAEVFDPVCGCDGVTYANACRAQAEGASVATSAPCADTNNGGPRACLDHADCAPSDYCARGDGCGAELVPSEGLCVARPEACAEVFDPVCGCDGATYPNACSANAAGVNVQQPGACG